MNGYTAGYLEELEKNETSLAQIEYFKDTDDQDCEEVNDHAFGEHVKTQMRKAKPTLTLTPSHRGERAGVVLHSGVVCSVCSAVVSSPVELHVVLLVPVCTTCAAKTADTDTCCWCGGTGKPVVPLL